MLNKVFDGMMIQTKSTTVSNHERTNTGLTAIETEVSSIRPDLVLFTNGVEYGVAECGNTDCDVEGINKKEPIEGNLDCPKIMKNFRMHVSIMDNSAGYTCRIHPTPNYVIYAVLSILSSYGLIPVLQLTPKSKLTVKKIYGAD
ncbi:hypothetical protein BDC45DRAFT_562993 [Circinella umbellata]|nr:hypothetical protein BDC45DRAFT_562993 [Circinella umbellata]